MFDITEESRLETRRYVEPYSSGTYLSLSLAGEAYKFPFLDVSPSGVGMLVKTENKAVLKKLYIGRILESEYGTPYATISTKFEVRHITKITRGPLEGHYQVGLQLISNSD
jgi:hypothetical protein